MLTANAKERLVVAGRLLLGGVLLTAGLQKVGAPVQFGQVLANYRLLPPLLEMPAAIAVPRLEVVVGLCLVAGLFVRAAAFVGVLLSLGFGAFVASALARGLNVQCGCFSGTAKVSWLHLGLDGVLLALAFGALLARPDRWRLERRLSLAQAGLGKRLAAVGTLLLISSLAVQVVVGSGLVPSSQAPALVFDPPQLNLARTAPGESVERTVIYRNAGYEPLEITWVQSSCRCTVPQPGIRKLAPGETGELKVKYHADPAKSTPAGPKTVPGRPSVEQTIKVYQRGHQDPAVLKVVIR